MSVTQTSHPTSVVGLRRSALLLIGTLAAFVVYVAFAVATIACAAAYIAVNVAAYGSETAWGDHVLYPWSVALSVAAGWFGVLPATMLVGATWPGAASPAAWLGPSP
jgi:hypothetical protein